jgi:hypothetical protein
MTKQNHSPKRTVEEFNLSEKIISIGEIREDANIMEKANMNPNMPEVIFVQDVRGAVRRKQLKKE